MKITYVRESSDRLTVLGYYERLYNAKADCREGESILCLKGCYFGEGFHQYRLILCSGKWVKKNLR